MQEKLMVIVKFILVAIFLPILIGSTMAFQHELARFDQVGRSALMYGMIGYLICRLFIYDFSHFYVWGQKLMGYVFQFFKPLEQIAPYLFPVYSILVLVVYSLFVYFGKVAQMKPIFLFLLSFTFVMHIILTAQDLHQKDEGLLKPTYFFAMSLVYILDVFLMALLASLILPGFSFPAFFGDLTTKTGEIYHLLIKQLF